MMVHVMTPKSRLFYDMEGQWRERGGEYLDLSDVLVDEVNGGVNAVNNVNGGVGEEHDDDDDEEEEKEMSMRERLDVEKKEDPFWS